jgi:hypothetical protein
VVFQNTMVAFDACSGPHRTIFRNTLSFIILIYYCY